MSVCITNDSDSSHLQKDLHALDGWGSKRQMRFNPKKYKLIMLGVTTIGTHTVRMNDATVTLSDTKEEKDLGVWVDSELKFSGHWHVNRAVIKGNKMLGLIKRSFVHKDRHMVKLLYMALVRPHLEYGNVIWPLRYKMDITLLESV